MHPNARQRHDLLAYLYEARELKPRAGWVSEYDLKQRFGDVGFALAVLAEIGHIAADGPQYRISGTGVPAAEAEAV